MSSKPEKLKKRPWATCVGQCIICFFTKTTMKDVLSAISRETERWRVVLVVPLDESPDPSLPFAVRVVWEYKSHGANLSCGMDIIKRRATNSTSGRHSITADEVLRRVEHKENSHSNS